ncbi:TonB-dependent receptor domain-containing protein, partial [Neisseria sp. P0021.S005]
YSRSQRAPEVNELYAGGDHYALMASESHWGVDVLRPETAGIWEVNGEIGWKDGRFRASWYKTQFKDYTFLVDAAHDGGQRLPTKYWRSGDTQLHGVELEVNQWFDLNKYGTLEARLFGDFVHNRADLDDERNSTLGNGNRVRNNGYY